MARLLDVSSHDRRPHVTTVKIINFAGPGDIHQQEEGGGGICAGGARGAHRAGGGGHHPAGPGRPQGRHAARPQAPGVGAIVGQWADSCVGGLLLRAHKRLAWTVDCSGRPGPLGRYATRPQAPGSEYIGRKLCRLVRPVIASGPPCSAS